MNKFNLSSQQVAAIRKSAKGVLPRFLVSGYAGNMKKMQDLNPKTAVYKKGVTKAGTRFGQ